MLGSKIKRSGWLLGLVGFALVCYLGHAAEISTTRIKATDAQFGTMSSARADIVQANISSATIEHLNFDTVSGVFTGTAELSNINNVFFVSAYASLNAAITALGSTVATIAIDEETTLTENLAVPANITLLFLSSGSINYSTYTLSLVNPPLAGEQKIFSGTGGVTITKGNINYVPYQWFSTTYTGDQTNAFTQAVNFTRSAAATLLLPPTTLLIGPYDNVEITTMLSIVGMGLQGIPGQTILKLNWAVVDTDADRYQFLVGGSGTVVRGVIFDGDKTTLGWAGNEVDKSCNIITNASTTTGWAYNVVLEDVEFWNLPGTTGKESFSFGVHCINNGYFKNIVHRNSNATFHIPGRLHAGIDDETNWAKDIIVDGFRVYNTAETDLGWMGFGTYGVKNLKLTNVHVEGNYYNGINLEYLDGAQISNVTSYNNGVSGLTLFGYQNNVYVDRPVFKGNGWNTAYASPAELSSIRIRAGSWWTAGTYPQALRGNPINATIYKPQIIDEDAEALQNVYFLIDSTTYMPSGWAVRPQSIKVITTPGDVFTFATQTFPYNVFLYPGVFFGPETTSPVIKLTEVFNSGLTVTETADTHSPYYKLTTTTQYSSLKIPVPKGVYAISGEVDVRETGEWAYKVANNAGTVTDISIKDVGSTSSSDGWRSFGFIVHTTEIDSLFTIIANSATGVSHETRIRNLRITPLSMDASYPSPTYIDGRRRFSVSAMPTSGYYVKGDFAYNVDSSVAGSGGSQYAVIGWYRLTTGSNNVLNTDWIAVRATTGT